MAVRSLKITCIANIGEILQTIPKMLSLFLILVIFTLKQILLLKKIGGGLIEGWLLFLTGYVILQIPFLLVPNMLVLNLYTFQSIFPILLGHISSLVVILYANQQGSLYMVTQAARNDSQIFLKPDHNVVMKTSLGFKQQLLIFSQCRITKRKKKKKRVTIKDINTYTNIV